MNDEDAATAVIIDSETGSILGGRLQDLKPLFFISHAIDSTARPATNSEGFRNSLCNAVRAHRDDSPSHTTIAVSSAAVSSVAC
eukprot:4648771-Pyramimonas_sp.AAC.1